MNRLKFYRRRIEAVMSAKIPHPDSQKSKCPRPWNLVAERQTKYSFQYAYLVPNSYSHLELKGQVDALHATCGAIIEIKPRAGVCEVHVFPEDMPEKIPVKEVLPLINRKGFLMGLDREHSPVYNFLDHPHAIFASETGFGKTTLIMFIFYQLVSQYSLDEIEILLIDMKGTDFIIFDGLPHLLPVVYNMKSAQSALSETVDLMRQRQEAIRKDRKNRNFKRRFVIIDEAAQLAPKAIRNPEQRKIADDVDLYISQLAAVGRSLGIHLIYCTQYPHSDIVNPQIRMNGGARCCFHVPKREFSDTILGEGGAELLTVKGRAIYKSLGESKLIQVPYADEDEYEAMLEPFKTKGGARIDGHRTEAPDDSEPDVGRSNCID